MTTPILQFGTSRFLQAHVDLFISESQAGPITIVETTGSDASRARIQAFNQMSAYPVQIKGIAQGLTLETEYSVTSIARGLSAKTHYADLCHIFIHEAEYIISNTGDKGFVFSEQTLTREAPWHSFPELLTHLLYQRFKAHQKPLTLMPCELISQNGDHLKQVILKIASLCKYGSSFETWLTQKCLWINSLVDRIVSEPLMPIGAIAEPYALWAIETQSGFIPPCQHPAIELYDDLTFVARRKLHLLNLGHTLLAEWWQRNHLPATQTVSQMLEDDDILTWLNQLMQQEVIPCFSGQEAEAKAYWNTCLERFRNPFLNHKLSDIATNHSDKISRRCHSLMRWKPQRSYPHLAQLFPME